VWKDRDEEFAAAFAIAERLAGYTLEREAVRRALDGTLEPITYHGHVTAYKRTYSDKMLELLLKGSMPSKYKEGINVDQSTKVLNITIGGEGADNI
jgi:hypothetical protein